jgi:hypothetical protein
MAEVDYKVDYNDERFQQVEADKNAAINSVDEAYGQVIGSTDELYQQQINATEEWGQKQQELQNQNTDFLIEKIEQDKAKAEKDYLKEQSGAYADWQKQSNQYGANAERQAAAGLTGTGFSESSQVAMYNNYQNRMVAAREVFSQAKLNYDNSIKEAKLQNSSVLAEIAYQTLQTTLQLGLDNAMYNNQLILDKANKKIEVDNAYWTRSQDVYNQIMEENKLAESVRQYEKNYELQIKEFNEKKRQFKLDHTQRVKEYEEGIRQFNEELKRLKAQDKAENNYKIKQLELEKAALDEEKRQYEKDYKLKVAQLDEEKRQYDKTYALQKANSSKSSSGSSGGSATSNKVKGGSTNASASTANDKNLTIDTQSIINLGYGPISASRLDELVRSGLVTETVSNGKLTYKKVNQADKWFERAFGGNTRAYK